MAIPARPHCVQEKHLMRNLKINELGPYQKVWYLDLWGLAACSLLVCSLMSRPHPRGEGPVAFG